MSDITFDQALDALNRIAAAGATGYIKWTCPECGDRCSSDEPNAISPHGYIHTERDDGSACGGIYRGQMFGLALVGPPDAVLAVLAREKADFTKALPRMEAE